MKSTSNRLPAIGLATCAVLCAFLALETVPRRAPLARLLPDWQNVDLLFIGLSLAAVVSLWITLRHRDSEPRAELALRYALVTGCGLTAVLLVKYLLGMIPDTWTGEVIYQYGVTGKSIVDLYSSEWIHEPPFVTPIYPPGYYLLARLLLALFGGAPVVLRGLTVFGVVGVAGALGMAGIDLCRRRWYVPSALFIALFPVLTWSGPPTKPEFVAASFTTFGLAAYLRWGFGESRGWIWLAGLLFGAGFLVKYTLIAAFLTVILHLLARRQAARAIALASVAGGTFFAVYGLLWAPTDGGIWLFTVSANAAHLLPEKIIRYGVLTFLPRAFTTVVLAAAVGTLVTPRRWWGRRGAVAAAPMIALGLFFLSIGRPGSSANYFLEFVILGSLLIGTWDWSQETSEASNAAGSGSAVSLATSTLLIALIVTQLPDQGALLSRSYGQATELETRTTQILRALPVPEGGFVLGDPEYTQELLAAGQTPLVYDASMFTLMVDNGVASVEPLLGYLQSGRVSHAVLTRLPSAYLKMPYGARDFPPEVAEYLRDHYHCSEQLQQWDGTPLITCALN